VQHIAALRNIILFTINLGECQQIRHVTPLMLNKTHKQGDKERDREREGERGIEREKGRGKRGRDGWGSRPLDTLQTAVHLNVIISECVVNYRVVIELMFVCYCSRLAFTGLGQK
jgi:hypothetical protein